MTFGIKYKVKEQLTYHVIDVHKLGTIPVGRHLSAAIENIEIGTQIRVRYNPDKPKHGYLPDNDGIHTF